MHTCDNPECASCKAGSLEAALAQEQEMIRKFGFAIRGILGKGDPNGMVNFITHGFETNYQQKDVQIVFPVGTMTALGILHRIHDLLKQGQRFKAEDTSFEVIHGFPIRFVAATENGRDILRIILPDKDGDVSETQAYPYRHQFTAPQT